MPYDIGDIPRGNRKDPREKRIARWELGVPMYALKVDGLPGGAVCAAGTNYPAAGKSAYTVYLELAQPLEHREARRLMERIYRAVLDHAQENSARVGAVALGAEDSPADLPFVKPLKRTAYAFWAFVPDRSCPGLALAFRTHFDMKDRLKEQFNAIWGHTPAKESLVRTGWWPEAKVWWIYAEHAYSKLLGRLREQGFKLIWIQREGFPPAPPVEEEVWNDGCRDEAVDR